MFWSILWLSIVAKGDRTTIENRRAILVRVGGYGKENMEAKKMETG